MSYETVGTNVYERLPIITNAAHCARALALVESGDLYIGIGRKSAWDNENEGDSFIPPEPDVDATNLDELIGMKKADRVLMVIPDENGEIEYANEKFRAISNEEAFRLKSRWVLVETTIQFKDLPPIAYRQIGIFSRVKAKEEHKEKDILLADEIEDVGILEILNNRKVVTRQSDTKDRYRMIIEY